MPLSARTPLWLTATRALLGPVLLVLACWHPSTGLIGACLVGALLCDHFDGVIARRLGVATPTLRRLDSAADTVFYVCALGAAWTLHPRFITAHGLATGVLVGVEPLRCAYDAAKFRRQASYPMWSSKLWGLLLFVGCFDLLARGSEGPLAALPIRFGIAADLEGLAISMVLPQWRSDVPSLLHAWRIRAASPCA